MSDGRNSWAFPFWKYDPVRMKPLYRDDNYEIYENTAAVPRVIMVSSYLIADDKKDILGNIYADGFDPVKTVVLEEKPEIEPETGIGIAEIIGYSENRSVVKTQSDSPKLLMFSDIFTNGWKAMVDDKPVRLYRANFELRAVAVPAGNHTVTFYYWPQYLTPALFISGVSFALMFVLKFIKLKI